MIYRLLITMTVLIGACASPTIKTPNNAMKELDAFKEKVKFAANDATGYVGLGDPSLQPALTEKINLAADDFKTLATKGNATDEAYQDAIEKGLKRFSEVYLYLDTEDREQVCAYFEELMDIVGLESSGGHLNHFMYEFEVE